MRNRVCVGEWSTPLGVVAMSLVLTIGCAGQEQEPAVAAAPASEPPPAAAPASPPAPVAAEPAPPAVPTAKQAMVIADVGFASPESAIYDPEQDVYFVSNINGQPLAKDDNGFISKVGSDGKVIDLKWLDGAKPRITLNAPKGMGISGSYLYVADINVLRIFDRKTGAPRGELAVKGASFLNDIAVDKHGVVYVSDTGWKAAAKEGLENSGTDAVFKVDPKVVSPKLVVQSQELGNPNGLVATAEGLWAVTAGGKLYKLSTDGKREQEGALPGKALDGIVALDDGNMLVSSWETSTVYMGKPGGTFEPLATAVKSPADIGYDTKRGRLLIPEYSENKLAIYDMPGNAELLAKADSKATVGEKSATPATQPAKPAQTPAMTPASGPSRVPASPAAQPPAASPQPHPTTPAQPTGQTQPTKAGAQSQSTPPAKPAEPKPAGATPATRPSAPAAMAPRGPDPSM